MSFWTYINGTVCVAPMGRTQPEKRYILDTVLAHLPRVTGSEGNMDTYVIQKNGNNGACSHDEFGQWSNLGNSGRKDTDHPFFETQSEYIIVVDAALRDRQFEITLKEFSNWLCRLSKRLRTRDVLVEIKDDGGKSIILRNENDVYGSMFEWGGEQGNETWSDYLMWDRMKDGDFPMLLAYKYFDNPDNDAEVERRKLYLRSEQDA